MLNSKRLFLLFISLCLHGVLLAQQTAEALPTDEGWMRSEAKIYVVGAVVLTILAGLIIYVIRLDRKISKLERSGK